jgi:ribonuclease E
MAKKMLIDATHAEETRVVVVDGNKVEEFDFESENKRQLAGNIYLAKVTRVEPSLQAAFVDYGGNRHGFLAFSEIHPDYYQIPVADREALMAEERAYAEAMRAREDEESTRQRPAKAQSVANRDAVERSDDIAGMETIDLSDEADEDQDDTAVSDVPEGTSPMERVAETPVEEPEEDTAEPEDASEESEDASDDSADVASESDDVADDAAEHDEEDGDTEETDDADGENGSKGSSSRRGRSSRSRSSRGRRSRAADKDDSIEAVADDDDHDDIRPPRKPRPRRYKIQEVIHVRQILLVQVVKEERGNKGAALTTYLSLAGRYCVLMPNTARGGGISRKITNAADRKKLKEIAAEIDVPTGAGLIVRTAGAKRTKAEIKRDYEYLQRLWEQIRELTLKSIAPAKIYEEGDLIKRSIRDLYNRDIDEVLVEGERGYRIAKDFMKMIMPSHAKNVKNYQDGLPLFARYQVESYLAGMFNPTVQLKSGGYIVIGVTEALVAIDVNSGRATKEGSIEETALKTNLEAAEEVARQLRLRDLAGLIVIDFIDMDERKNNAAVEKRIKDKLKTDRARIQVGRISGFGLMEMSRQRLRPGMIEATTQPCPACHGTGLIRSDDSMALSILRQIEEEGTRRRSREVLVKCPVAIANYLMNQKREHIAQIEARYGMAVRIEGDVHLVSPDFSLEKFKTATRNIQAQVAPVVSVDTSIMDQIDDEVTDEDAGETVEENATSDDGETKPKRKRRRRRRKPSSKSQRDDAQDGDDDTADDEGSEENAAEGTNAGADDATKVEADAKTEEPAEEKPKSSRSRSSRSRSSSSRSKAAKAENTEETAETTSDAADAESVEEKPKPKVTRSRSSSSRSRSSSKKKVADEAEAPADAAPEAEADEATVAPVTDAQADDAPVAAAEEVEAPKDAPVATTEPEPEQQPEAEPQAQPAPEPEPVAAEAEPASPPKPKKRGWWSMGR